MKKSIIQTNKAPAAIGPYSQGIGTDFLIFISGQLPLRPGEKELVKGTIGERTRQVLENIKSIAQEGGADLDQVVKTTIFLTDLSDFQEVNGVYAEYFGDTPPARSTVAVAALPLGSNIEIEAILINK